MLRFKQFCEHQLEESYSFGSSQTSLSEVPPPMLTWTRVGISARSAKGPNLIISYYCKQIDQYATVLVNENSPRNKTV